MFGTTKTLLAAVAGVLVGALVAPAPAAAQEPTTVTGCLSKGAAAGTFSLKGEDGKAYTLTTTDVKLDGHVGHKVTVIGTAAGVETGAVIDTGMARDTGVAGDTGMAHDPGMKPHAGMEHDTGMKKEAAAPGAALNVTTLTHVSTTCS